jgi:TatA/E family protein of Tat protein translocase
VLANIIDISPLTLLVLLVLALLILGPGKLPEVGAALGKSIREFRNATNDLRESADLSTSATPAPAAPAPATPAQAASTAGADVADQPPLDDKERIRQLEARLHELEQERQSGSDSAER